MYMNQLTIIGFTGSNAEVHYTPNGTLVATLSIATKESWKNADGEWQSRTEMASGADLRQIGRIRPTLTKGSHLMVPRAVRTREYEKDGIKRRVFELRAETIAKLDRAERRQEADTEPDA